MRQLRYFGYNTSTIPRSPEEYILFFGTLFILGLAFRYFYHRYVLEEEQKKKTTMTSDTTKIRIYTPRSQNFQIRIDISNIPHLDLTTASSDSVETKKTV